MLPIRHSGVLEKTKVYLIGHMQYMSGKAWRDFAESELQDMGITVFNPLKKPFEADVEEGDNVAKEMAEQMENGQYLEVYRRMKNIRAFDLNLVDRSDFIIGHFYPNIASWGSAEELAVAVRMKKPIFLSIEGGISKTPYWIMGQIPPECLYDSVESIIEEISRINSGEKQVSLERWRLLKKEKR